MYKITVVTEGKYRNVVTGSRYCLLKSDAKQMINWFIDEYKCELVVEKFMRLSRLVWMWSCDEDDEVLNYYKVKLVNCGKEDD